jgi:hypothetical protein
VRFNLSITGAANPSAIATRAVLQAQAYEAHLRAELDAPAPASALFGAAGHVARYQMPKLAVL